MAIYDKQEKFRFWCQKTLPLVYDESLSYYELLCKVVNYLNETSGNVNMLIDAVNGLERDVAEIKEDVSGDNELVVWGGSSVALNNWANLLGNKLGLTTVNCGIPGANLDTVLFACGVMPIWVNHIVIPASATPVRIGNIGQPFENVCGNFSNIIMTNSDLTGSIEVSIDGVVGSLSQHITYYDDATNMPLEGYFEFRRHVPGDRRTIERPTPVLTTDYIRHKNAKLNILVLPYTYTDEDFEPLLHLISDEFSNVLVCRDFADNFIHVGAFLGALIEVFGKRFFNLRDYLLEYGLSDANIEPTEADLRAIESGHLPPSLGDYYFGEVTQKCNEIIANNLYRWLTNTNANYA